MAGTCSGCSRGPSYAPGFKRTKESMKQFGNDVDSYWHKSGLPELSKVSTWKIWHVKPSQWFDHHSLLIQSVETGVSFTIELVAFIGEGVKPRSRCFDPSEHHDLKYELLGEVTFAAQTLFRKALECLENFGDYNLMCNNCQNYCQV